jgi:intracellular septation protein
MKPALWQLANDFLSAIFFLVLYSLTGNITLATASAIIIGVAQLVRLKLARRRIEPMQGMSLGLVVALGGATMLTQSPRYLPKIVLPRVPEPMIVAAGYAWAALLAALGLANLVIAVRFDFATWAWFISVGSVGAKLALFALQYGIFRTTARQRVGQSAV